MWEMLSSLRNLMKCRDTTFRSSCCNGGDLIKNYPVYIEVKPGEKLFIYDKKCLKKFLKMSNDELNKSLKKSISIYNALDNCEGESLQIFSNQ